MEETRENQFAVRLTSADVTSPLARRKRQVTFDVTPDLTENRVINYKTIDPLHAPGQIMIYANTSSRTFALSNVRLISRTKQEASINLQKLWTLRSWTVPSFGQDAFTDQRQRQLDAARQQNPTGTQSDINQMVRDIEQGVSGSTLGAPPQVLLLSAYSRGGSIGTGGIGHLRRIPVVITNLSINYPSDVDYIPTADTNPTPMPTIMTVEISLTETHSPVEYERFSLDDFRSGNLIGF